VGKVLGQLERDRLSPLLNVGSATAAFRQQVQPWMDREIFAPLCMRGVVLEHLDMQEGEGIDLRGDLTDDAFVAGLSNRGYRTILCCNVLEHVIDPASICAKLERIISPGGYLLVTVPNRFPYHPDPIDTMFRPDLAALIRLFPHCHLLDGEVLDCGTGWDYVDRNPSVMIAKLRRRLSGLKEHGGVKGSASFMPWLFRRFWQTCALLQKQD